MTKLYGGESSKNASQNVAPRRLTVPHIQAMKGKVPIVSLTAYTTSVAAAMDEAVDLILVGDSVGMVIYGMETTMAVTVEMMIAHTKAVMRGTQRACVMVDLPFGSYQKSPEQAFETSARLLAETGAAAVKLEGGVEMAETIAFLTRRGVPVCGHIGLMPQSVQVMGGFKITGKNEEQSKKVIEDAQAVVEAGAFAIVLEGVIEPVAAQITDMLAIPTIGIGASPHCDGQVLVSEDLFGSFGGFVPRFVKQYAHFAADMRAAVQEYAADVRSRTFPAPEHCFYPKK